MCNVHNPPCYGEGTPCHSTTRTPAGDAAAEATRYEIDDNTAVAEKRWVRREEMATLVM